jgi:hypothetical protein
VSRKPESFLEGFCNLPGAGYTAPMKSRFYFTLAVLALAWGASGQSVPATNLTAFALVKEGDKFIPPQAKDRITQIRSEKSEGGLIPSVWYVDYYDATTAFKVTEVKFVDGKMTEVNHPKHVLDMFTGTKQLEWRKLKVDSNRALAIGRKEALLKTTELKAVQFWLERTAVGSTWRIRFWTTKLTKPDETIDIGELYISSKNGEVLKNNLHF